MDKARETAVRILYEVHENGAYANVALAKALRQAELGEQDRRFVTELVYGAVKAGGTLDWILRRYVNRPVRHWWQALWLFQGCPERNPYRNQLSACQASAHS